MYRFLFTIVFFVKKKNNTHKTFHILKMKARLKKEPHFENESSFCNPFWKWKHVYAFTVLCCNLFFPFQPNRIGSWSPTFASVWKRTGSWVDSIDYRYFDHRVPLLFIVRTQSPTPSNGKQSLSSFFFSDNFLSQPYFQSLLGNVFGCCKFGEKVFWVKNYHKVASSNTSRLEAHAGFFWLLMKGIFNPYLLWPFDI